MGQIAELRAYLLDSNGPTDTTERLKVREGSGDRKSAAGVQPRLGCALLAFIPKLFRYA